MDFTAIAKNVWDNMVVASYREAYVRSFLTRIPKEIAEKLTEEEQQRLAQISMDVMHHAINFTKNTVLGATNNEK